MEQATPFAPSPFGPSTDAPEERPPLREATPLLFGVRLLVLGLGLVQSLIGVRAARRFARSAYDPRVHPDRYVLPADDAARARRRSVTATLRAAILEWRADRGLPGPTLLVLGSRDRNSTPAMRRRLGRTLPTARFEVLPDAAHFANLDDPHGLNTLLREHFARATAHTLS